MAYTDPMETLLTLEQDLRRKIALRIAQERGEPTAAVPTEDQLTAAGDAIDAWRDDIEAEQDPRAFREQTPLQMLLAAHREICERILNLRDSRLS